MNTTLESNTISDRDFNITQFDRMFNSFSQKARLTETIHERKFMLTWTKDAGIVLCDINYVIRPKTVLVKVKSIISLDPIRLIVLPRPLDYVNGLTCSSIIKPGYNLLSAEKYLIIFN